MLTVLKKKTVILNLILNLNSYLIQSNFTRPNADRHLNSWNIKGSNDKNNWVLLDERENESKLNGPGNQCHFI